MTDILLIQPPFRDFYATAKRSLPYGLACIAASLLQHGFSVEILDGLATSKSRNIPLPEEMGYLSEFYGNADLSPFALFHQYKHFGYSLEHIGKQAKASGAFLIGISSLFTAYSPEALQTARTVKACHPSCKIVMGGHHPTALPEAVMACSAIDYGFRGEGEVSLSILASILKTDKSPSDDLLSTVPGLVFRKSDASLHVSEPVWMQDLSDAPLPAMHLVRSKYYRRGKSGASVIVASRGCPMTCTYCSLGKNSKIPYRRKSLEAVLREMEQAIDATDAGFIDFEDENLSLDRNWFMDLLSAIQARFPESGPELRAMNGLSPASLDREMIFAMKAAGFKTLNLSLGTTSSAQLKRFHRPNMQSAFENALELTERCGLNAVGYIIVAAPFQNPMDAVEDLLYLASLRTLAGVSVFYPSPGSVDYDLSVRLGILPEYLSLMRSSALPLSHTTSRIESVTLMRLGRLLNFIKSLIDQEIDFETEAAEDSNKSMSLENRQESGIRLLQMFLADGRIRGITPDGGIYEHDVSLDLTRRFRNGLRSIEIKGVNK
ncbi:MAG: B12-binding domain-containing radical SAM protein [Deltaproteobacteria bacterium]|nr:B12-binding domain-containing radical SAM protein [Deltaproteobacteria bacterium]